MTDGKKIKKDFARLETFTEIPDSYKKLELTSVITLIQGDEQQPNVIQAIDSDGILVTNGLW